MNDRTEEPDDDFSKSKGMRRNTMEGKVSYRFVIVIIRPGNHFVTYKVIIFNITLSVFPTSPEF